MKQHLKDLEDVKNFETKTYTEVKIWDWLGRILPLSVLATIAIAKLMEWNSVLGLIIEFSVIVFFIICFIWWYWAIYKIAVTVRYMRKSQEEFVSVSDEIRKFKQELKKNKANSKE
jgi:hypothetical protein